MESETTKTKKTENSNTKKDSKQNELPEWARQISDFFQNKTLSEDDQNNANKPKDSNLKNEQNKNGSVFDHRERILNSYAQARQNADARMKSFKSKLSLKMDKHSFKLQFNDFKNASEVFEYYRDSGHNTAYEWLLNSRITSFHVRFLSYEEFVLGAWQGLEFLFECLKDHDFEALEGCVDSSILTNNNNDNHCVIESVRDKLFEDFEGHIDDTTEIELDGVLPLITNAGVKRLNPSEATSSEESGTHQPISIQCTVSVRYYLKMHPKFSESQIKYKHLDCTWESVWKPSNDKLYLQFEIEKDWLITDLK